MAVLEPIGACFLARRNRCFSTLLVWKQASTSSRQAKVIRIHYIWFYNIHSVFSFMNLSKIRIHYIWFYKINSIQCFLLWFHQNVRYLYSFLIWRLLEFITFDSIKFIHSVFSLMIPSKCKLPIFFLISGSIMIGLLTYILLRGIL